MTPEDRLTAYGRYLALVEEQLRALDAGDLERFGALAGERDLLARGIDRAPAALPTEEVADVLRRCLAADARVRARLEALREDARERVRELDSRRGAVTPYLAVPAGTRLDRRS